MKSNLKEIRDRAGIPVKEFSDKVGVSAASVYLWESGKSYPKIKIRKKICEILQKEPDTIFPEIFDKKEKPPKATHSGKLKIGDLELDCYVLEDKTRILSQSQMTKALGFKGISGPRNGLSTLPPFLDKKTLQPFIGEDLTGCALPKKFILPQGGLANGYDGRLLPKICDVFVKASEAGALQISQSHIVEQCQVLKSAFAEVGIIALIDEATGYQKVREGNAMSSIFERYLAEEIRPYMKTFPDIFYQNIFRLKGWGIFNRNQKKPIQMANITNDLVYTRAFPGLLKRLQILNPKNDKGVRKYKHFQLLSEEKVTVEKDEFGVENETIVPLFALKHQIKMITKIAMKHTDWDKFMADVDHFYPVEEENVARLNVIDAKILRDLENEDQIVKEELSKTE